MSVVDRIKAALGLGERTEREPSESKASAASSSGTPLDGDVEQRGDLQLTSPAFEEGGRLPDWTGYANANENPPLEISGVPDNAESLVLVMDDPDAEPVVGHVYDHWLVWDVDAKQEEIPRDWDTEGAIVGFNDYGESDWSGPAPPEGSHTYEFKLLALADELEAPPQTRKQRLASMAYNQTEILAATQLEGTYDAEQGTIF